MSVTRARVSLPLVLRGLDSRTLPFLSGLGQGVGRDHGDTGVFHIARQRKALAPMDLSYEPCGGGNIGRPFAFAVTIP